MSLESFNSPAREPEENPSEYLLDEGDFNLPSGALSDLMKNVNTWLDTQKRELSSLDAANCAEIVGIFMSLMNPASYGVTEEEFPRIEKTLYLYLMRAVLVARETSLMVESLDTEPEMISQQNLWQQKRLELYEAPEAMTVLLEVLNQPGVILSTVHVCPDGKTVLFAQSVADEKGQPEYQAVKYNASTRQSEVFFSSYQPLIGTAYYDEDKLMVVTEEPGETEATRAVVRTVATTKENELEPVAELTSKITAMGKQMITYAGYADGQPQETTSLQPLRAGPYPLANFPWSGMVKKGEELLIPLPNHPHYLSPQVELPGHRELPYDLQVLQKTVKDPGGFVYLTYNDSSRESKIFMNENPEPLDDPSEKTYLAHHYFRLEYAKLDACMVVLQKVEEKSWPGRKKRELSSQYEIWQVFERGGKLDHLVAMFDIGKSLPQSRQEVREVVGSQLGSQLLAVRFQGYKWVDVFGDFKPARIVEKNQLVVQVRAYSKDKKSVITTFEGLADQEPAIAISDSGLFYASEPGTLHRIHNKNGLPVDEEMSYPALPPEIRLEGLAVDDGTTSPLVLTSDGGQHVGQIRYPLEEERQMLIIGSYHTSLALGDEAEPWYGKRLEKVTEPSKEEKVKPPRYHNTPQPVPRLLFGNRLLKINEASGRVGIISLGDLEAPLEYGPKPKDMHNWRTFLPEYLHILLAWYVQLQPKDIWAHFQVKESVNVVSAPGTAATLSEAEPGEPTGKGVVRYHQFSEKKWFWQEKFALEKNRCLALARLYVPKDYAEIEALFKDCEAAMKQAWVDKTLLQTSSMDKAPDPKKEELLRASRNPQTPS